jgi:C4-dicarboxylate-binding protein DctP
LRGAPSFCTIAARVHDHPGPSVKRLWLWLVALCAIGLPVAADAQQAKLRVTLQVAIAEQFLGVPLALFKEEVEKRSRNAVSIEIFDKGTLYVDTQVVDAVSSGAIEMGVAGTHMVAKRVPEINVVQQPFLLNFEALLRAATAPDSEMRKEIDAAVREATGARVLWWYSAGNTVFFSKGKDVTEPAAIANQRVRVFSQLTEELTKQCGGTPVTVPVAKMLDAINDGRVDMSMGSVNSVQTRELWQVNDILTATNHASSFCCSSTRRHGMR